LGEASEEAQQARLGDQRIGELEQVAAFLQDRDRLLVPLERLLEPSVPFEDEARGGEDAPAEVVVGAPALRRELDSLRRLPARPIEAPETSEYPHPLGAVHEGVEVVLAAALPDRKDGLHFAERLLITAPQVEGQRDIPAGAERVV